MLQFLARFNLFVGLFMFIAYFYQVLYTVYGLFVKPAGRRKKQQKKKDVPLHRFAALICARNEEHVIGELVASLKAQDYPADLLDIYVLADNCTDGTAQAAEKAGAIAYERFNQAHVGKGYALDFLLGRIRKLHGDNHYDGFFVFDADNIVDRHFVSAMNETFSEGCDVITCYRNSKNFASSWISASYSIWFLREARFLNFPRMKMGTNCAVSGTGFLVASHIIRENDGWPYFLLTEDIQFSADCAARGWRIGYSDDAIIYDEQPITMRQSWRQRMRWAKGFYQVNAHCSLDLLRGCFIGPRRFSCYDMLMTIAPCMLLTVSTIVVNLFFAISFLTLPSFLAGFMFKTAMSYLVFGLAWMYTLMCLYGLLTVVTEWKRIPTTAFKKLQYIPMFPLFMLTYIPISLAALVVHVEWKPISHTSVENVKV